MTLPNGSQMQAFQALQPRDPVTLVVRRRVRPGQEEAFESLVSGISDTLLRWPGHLGTGVVRPVPGQREYTMVVRFDDAAGRRIQKQLDLGFHEAPTLCAPQNPATLPSRRPPGQGRRASRLSAPLYALIEV